MRFKKKVTVEHEYDDGATCDLCGRELGRQSVRYGNAAEVAVEARFGDAYAEGDNRRVIEADICPPCFEMKIRPALEAIGVVFRERHADDDGRILRGGAPR